MHLATFAFTLPEAAKAVSGMRRRYPVFQEAGEAMRPLAVDVGYRLDGMEALRFAPSGESSAEADPESGGSGFEKTRFRVEPGAAPDLFPLDRPERARRLRRIRGQGECSESMKQDRGPGRADTVILICARCGGRFPGPGVPRNGRIYCCDKCAARRTARKMLRKLPVINALVGAGAALDWLWGRGQR
jgi:hypothetical protein